MILKRLVVIACVVAAIATVFAYVSLVTGGDRNMWGTLVLFAPRRFVPVGWLMLAIVAAFVTRRWAVFALAASLISLVTLAGFRVPTEKLFGQPSQNVTTSFVVATYNVDYASSLGGMLGPAVARWDADVILLQACSANAASDLQQAFAGKGTVGQVGEFCVATRHKVLGAHLLGMLEPFSPRSANLGLLLRLAVGKDTLTVLSVHLSSPRDALLAALQGDISGLKTEPAVRAAQAGQLARLAEAARGPLIMAGDFNVLPESRIYREHLSTLQNAFHRVGWGFGYTMRAGLHRIRIDHVLTSDHIRTEGLRVESGWPTEHSPVIATLQVPFE